MNYQRALRYLWEGFPLILLITLGGIAVTEAIHRIGKRSGSPWLSASIYVPSGIFVYFGVDFLCSFCGWVPDTVVPFTPIYLVPLLSFYLALRILVGQGPGREGRRSRQKAAAGTVILSWGLFLFYFYRCVVVYW